MTESKKIILYFLPFPLFNFFSYFYKKFHNRGVVHDLMKHVRRVYSFISNQREWQKRTTTRI